MSADFRIERSTWASRFGVVAMLAAAALLLAVPAWAGSGTIRLAVEILYSLALAQAWNLLAGYAGLVSIGQQAFVGLGGYGLVYFTVMWGVPPLASLALAGIATAIVAVPTAFVLFRLRGAYFAIGTWVVAEVYRLVVAQDYALGGGTGMSLPVAAVLSIGASREMRDLIFYYLGLGVGLGSILLVFFWLRSRHGLALTAIRDSETAAASVGVNNAGAKLAVYVIAAGLTGLVGALAYLEKVRISPNSAFSVVDWTANIIFIVVIGGIGSIEGPIVGTIIYFVLRGVLADYGALYMILLGAVAVVVMLVAPRGIWGLVTDRFDVHLFPVQRRVRLLGEGRREAVRASPAAGD